MTLFLSVMNRNWFPFSTSLKNHIGCIVHQLNGNLSKNLNQIISVMIFSLSSPAACRHNHCWKLDLMFLLSSLVTFITQWFDLPLFCYSTISSSLISQTWDNKPAWDYYYYFLSTRIYSMFVYVLTKGYKERLMVSYSTLHPHIIDTAHIEIAEVILSFFDCFPPKISGIKGKG